MNDTAIQIEHLSKYYRLGVINNGVLFRDIQTWIALKRGKPDPHSKIGEHKYDGTENGFWALKDLNFEIKQGDRVGIIGKNGAGKSTLLKILSRITAPTEGTVKIRGRVASLLEVGTGFHGELTGRENIYLNGAILGMKKKEVDRKIDEIIDFSGIEQHIDTPAKRYSSGMYVRLAFAVAAHLDSEILIADEVLAVGDAEFQKKALGKMNELSMGQGRTVLFVSHQMSAVQNLCNRGFILEKGRIIYSAHNISNVVSKYLNKNKDNLQKLKWVNTDTKTKNKFFYPISFEIENHENMEIPSEKSISVKIIFEVEEIDTAMYWGISLRNATEDRLFLVSPTEEIKDYIVHKGVNTVTCILPAHLLNTGQFSLTLEASSTTNGWICNPYESGPRIDFACIRKVENSFNNTNALMPFCHWKELQ